MMTHPAKPSRVSFLSLAAIAGMLLALAASPARALDTVSAPDVDGTMATVGQEITGATAAGFATLNSPISPFWLTFQQFLNMGLTAHAGAVNIGQLNGGMINAQIADASNTIGWQNVVNNAVATHAIRNSIGTTSAFGLQCVSATLSAGLASASVGSDQFYSLFNGQNANGGGVIPTPTPNVPGKTPTAPLEPNNSSSYAAGVSSSQRVNYLISNINALFCNPNTDGQTTCASIYPNTPYRDTDVTDLNKDLLYDYTATTPVAQDWNAYEQYMDYIRGMVPEDPSMDPTTRNSPPGKAATLVQREKIAFMNTAIDAFQKQFSERGPSTSGMSVASMQQIFTSIYGQNATMPTVPLTQDGTKTSLDGLLDTLYRAPFEDPNTIANLPAHEVNASLHDITTELIMENYLNYRRYRVEQANLKVNSAMLALMTRQANFAQ